MKFDFHIFIFEYVFQSEHYADYLDVLDGPNSGSPQLHRLTGNLGAKTIKWSEKFVSIYWRTSWRFTHSTMTGHLKYVP